METARTRHAAQPEKKSEAIPARTTRLARKGKGKRVIEDEPSSPPAKRAKTGNQDVTDSDADQEETVAQEENVQLPTFKQSVLITGAKLKDYQLEGVAWMVGLYGQGISGILGEH